MELLAGYAIGKVKDENEFYLFEGDCPCCGIFTGLIVKCESEQRAIEVCNDHIPLLDGCILEDPVIIRVK